MKQSRSRHGPDCHVTTFLAMTDHLEQRKLFRGFVFLFQFIDGLLYGMEIVIVDENIFVMIEIRLEFEICDLCRFCFRYRVQLDELFTLQSTLSSINQFLMNAAGDFVEVIIDIFDGLIFDDKVASGLGADARNSFYVVATIPY